MENWVDLKPDRNLIDSQFEGYRLSLDKLPFYETPLNKNARVVNLPTHQFSLEHVKTFTSHNQLYSDRFNVGLLYYIGLDLSVQLIEDTEALCAADTVEVVSALPPNNLSDKEEYNASLSFPSERLALVSDGKGCLTLFETGDRKLKSPWKLLQRLPTTFSFILQDSMTLPESNGNSFSYVMSHVKEENKKFVTLVTWNVLTKGADAEGLYAVTGTQTYRLCGLEYVSLDDQGNLFVASQTHSFSDDTPMEKDTNASEKDISTEDAGKTLTYYTWLQADDDIIATFPLPPATNKADISLAFAPKSLRVRVKGETRLEGDLHADISPDDCTWTLCNENSLQLYISKREAGWWPQFVIGDERGEMITDLDTADRISESLQYLTSEEMDTTEGRAPGVSTQELEACDFAHSDDSLFLCTMRMGAQRPLATVNLTGTQWLYKGNTSLGSPASFCTRHDVDGLLWQPRGQGYTHAATFNALGYVQASKERRRFITSPPSHSYVAICDTDRHVYIYRQPTPVQSDLRNRRTGQAVSHIATQQVLTVDSSDNIVGFKATGVSVYALTQSKLFKFLVTQD